MDFEHSPSAPACPHVSQDTFLAEAYSYARYMRIGDGPDQVHLAQLGRGLLKRWGTPV